MDMHTKLTILRTTARLVDLSKWEPGAFITIRYDETDTAGWNESFQVELVKNDEGATSGFTIIDGFSKYGLTFEEAMDQLIAFGERDNKVEVEEGLNLY